MQGAPAVGRTCSGRLCSLRPSPPPSAPLLSPFLLLLKNKTPLLRCSDAPLTLLERSYLVSSLAISCT